MSNLILILTHLLTPRDLLPTKVPRLRLCVRPVWLGIFLDGAEYFARLYEVFVLVLRRLNGFGTSLDDWHYTKGSYFVWRIFALLRKIMVGEKSLYGYRPLETKSTAKCCRKSV